MASRANGDNHHYHHQEQQQYQEQNPPPNSSNNRWLPPPPAQQQHQRRRSNHYMAPYSSSGGISSSSSSAASFKGCCCCLFLLLTFLALLVVAVALVIVLAVKPRKPQFDLQGVGVQYLLVTTNPTAQAEAAAAAAPAAAYLTLNITMVFTAENPNKVGIRYAAAGFYVMYRGVPLGVALLPGFEQPAHSTRLVATRVVVDRVDVLRSDAAELVRDATLNDRVDLRVVGDVGAKIRFLGVTSPRIQVSVDCAIVISPRKQSLTYKQCGVDGLNI